MGRFMFVVPPFFGHISPTLSVGAGLLAKGHQVMWVGMKELPDEYIPEGGKYIVPQELTEHEEEIQKILRRQDEGPALSMAETLKLALEETYLPFCRLLMKGLFRLVDEFQPVVIIHDCITFAGAICAYIKGIPYVTSTPVPPDLLSKLPAAPKIYQWQHSLIMGLQEEFGICTQQYVIHSDRMNLVFSSQTFTQSKIHPPSLKFVGPVTGRPDTVSFNWEKLQQARSPKVFVSLGTLLVDIREDFFWKLAEAFADQPVTIVAATDPGTLAKWPDNFIVQRFVPQSQLVSRVDAVICHGGFNTVNDTLLNGLPMVIVPMAYDQFHTAYLVESAGCGIRLRYKRLRVTDLKEALWEIINNEKYRKAAAKVRDTFIEAGGTEKAVRHLEEFAQRVKLVEKEMYER